MQKKKQIKGKAVIVKKKSAGITGGKVKKNNAAKNNIKKSVPKSTPKKTAKKPVAKKAAVKKPLAKKAPLKKTVVKKPLAKKPAAKKITAKKPVKKTTATKPVKKPVAKKTIKKVVKKELSIKNKKTVVPVKKVLTQKPAPSPKKEVKQVVKKVEKKEMKKETKKTVAPEIQKANMNTVVEKIRYNDEDLMEFKQIILKKLEEAHSDLVLLTEAYTTKNAHDTNDTSPTFKVLEEGSNVLSKEENSQLAARQKKFIRDLENALLRIENKTYGICRVTGKLIPKERLRVVPHATMSIEAKLQQPQKR